MNRTAIHASICCAITCTVAIAAFAAGGVPVYPNAANALAGMPANAGLMQLTTADPVAKVDAWYGANLPKNCTHQTARGGAKYACPGTNIMITPSNGKTVITHMSSGLGGR